MSHNLLHNLKRHQLLFDVLCLHSKLTSTSCFGDLIWPSDSLDPFELCQEIGTKFETADRIFVLLRIKDEIRYFAGPNQQSEYDSECEIGIFPNEISALTFGVEFIANHLPFSQINVERHVKFH